MQARQPNVSNLPVTIHIGRFPDKIQGHWIEMFMILLGLIIALGLCPGNELCWLEKMTGGLCIAVGIVLVWVERTSRRVIKIDEKYVFGTEFGLLGPKRCWQEPVSQYEGVKGSNWSDSELGFRCHVELVHPDCQKTFRIWGPNYYGHWSADKKGAEETARLFQERVGAALNLPLLSNKTHYADK